MLLTFLMVGSIESAGAQQTHNSRDLKLAPTRWWCSPERGHAGGLLCKTAAFKDAIAMAESAQDKQSKVNELRAAITAGNAEAEGLDQTNPERHRMMQACE